MLAPEILHAYPELDDGQGPCAAASLPLSPLSGGLINETYALGQRYVLQRLHPIFRAEVNDDIAALLPPLRRGGVPVPELVRTRAGGTCVVYDGAPWRILTRLPGETRARLRQPGDGEAGGAMLARFHGALRGVAHRFAFERPGAHDTAAHVGSVRAALRAHSAHRLYAPVAALADALEMLWAAFGPLPVLPPRIVHGDPKVSNLLWEDGRVVGVVDLDTMAYAGVDIELGDALRSWANKGTEDAQQPALCLDTAAATLGAYLAGAAEWITPAEIQALPRAMERIALELSARFAADALNEGYFGWDASRYATRGAHNLARAQNQLGLAQAAAAARGQLEDVVGRAAERSVAGRHSPAS